MRMELYIKGIDPGPLLSMRDRQLRKALGKQKATESHMLMTQIAAATNNIDLMKTQYRKAVAALWFEDIEDRYAEMMDEYQNNVKHLRPTMELEDGQAVVRGLIDG
jgi:hypothetical protein